MNTISLNIRMDSDVKEQFDEFCSNVGMSMSTLFNVFAKTVVREKKIPFEIKYEDPFYSENNLKALNHAIESYNNDKLTKHDLIEE